MFKELEIHAVNRYTGVNCDVILDPCQSDPCYHGATCVKVTEGYQCMCTPDFLGDRCEAIKRHCVVDNPCLNGALCEDKPNGNFRYWYSLIFTKWQTLDSSNLKAFADDNFQFDENGRKFSKQLEQLENTVGKGEIARYEQFLLFIQCFQKTCTSDT